MVATKEVLDATEGVVATKEVLDATEGVVHTMSTGQLSTCESRHLTKRRSVETERCSICIVHHYQCIPISGMVEVVFFDCHQIIL